MVEAKGGASHYLIFFFLLLPLLDNFFAVVNPWIIEVVIIRAPPPVPTGLGEWFVRSVFGSFSDFPYDVFISILLGLYVISFLMGFLIAILLLRRIFGQLLRNREVTFSDGRFVLRIALDFFVVFYLTALAFDRILVYMVYMIGYPYPWSLGLWSSSYISLYIFTGFVTGDTVGKSVFPLRLRWMCWRDKLEFKALKVVSSSVNKSHREPSLTKWVLRPASRSDQS